MEFTVKDGFRFGIGMMTARMLVNIVSEIVTPSLRKLVEELKGGNDVS